MEETLLGFHLRILPKSVNDWDNNRRENYLLREDILCPLSVDDKVWPNCNYKKLFLHCFQNYYESPYEKPNGLSLYEIAHLNILKETLDNAILIGISAIDMPNNKINTLINEHRIKNTTNIMNLIEAKWQCLGYDIADNWLCSGLMNCSYENYSKSILAKRVSSEINQYGLFSLVNDAIDLLNEFDSRVPEHAPFTAFGIWVKDKPMCLV